MKALEKLYSLEEEFENLKGNYAILEQISKSNLETKFYEETLKKTNMVVSFSIQLLREGQVIFSIFKLGDGRLFDAEAPLPIDEIKMIQESLEGKVNIPKYENGKITFKVLESEWIKNQPESKKFFETHKELQNLKDEKSKLEGKIFSTIEENIPNKRGPWGRASIDSEGNIEFKSVEFNLEELEKLKNDFKAKDVCVITDQNNHFVFKIIEPRMIWELEE